MIASRKRLALAATAAALLVATAVALPPARAQVPAPAGHDLERTLQALAERVVPRTACVYGAIGLGSGAVVDHRGTVVTNAHVALAARVAILEFADGRRVVARRRGIDFEKDLAVLEPEEELAAPVPCFDLGSDRPGVGTWVAAVGYPGGPRGDLRPTFSVGQVLEGSGLPAPVMGVLDYSDAIRTDIAIYEGNSGGPLVDREGHLLGINGAFDPSSGAAFAIPLSVVVERLSMLENGVIRFPGGRHVDETNPIVAALGRQLDPVVRRLVDRVHEGFDPNPKGEDGRGGLLDREAGPSDDAAQARAAVVERERGSPRSKALAALVEPGLAAGKSLAVRLEGGILATRVSRRHLVTKLSFLGSRREWKVEPSGHARVVAVAEQHDLALLALDADASVELAPDAGARPAGSIVAAVGPDGLLGAGVVSVGPRAISEALSYRIAGGGAPRVRLLKLVRAAKQALGRVSKDLAGLLEAIENQMETAQALGTGNEPRGYARVLSHDAALLPLEAGAPLVDLDGRLVGVNVSNANYGTSYAVPIETIREAFGTAIGGTIVPETVGKAKLY